MRERGEARKEGKKTVGSHIGGERTGRVEELRRVVDSPRSRNHTNSGLSIACHYFPIFSTQGK